ncbi:adenylyl-sulfate kinase [Desulfovibrio legallii]|jgi:adenylylsulfate kinase-like enzyme|uniref:Adenylylsulfate kinase n=1 Tax=Desulfovibrio legallii TaxID=571438 RepID=A0A1G7N3F2_9BACT|nr:adenylyl-sulfate kinase [Desulfovibrio legallii]SDF67850.1 adenylylsulfate kinase [Desulfovibrio legallii]
MTPVIWLLGLSGSGKTTLGSLLRLYLEGRGQATTLLDGDRFRREHGFHGFRPEDRRRNIDALRDAAAREQALGRVCIVAAITPYADMRRKNRELLPRYREVWVRCGLATLLQRDTKGLYSAAAQGRVDRLSGVSDAFDAPREAHAVIDTDRRTLAECYELLRNLTLDALEGQDETRPALPPARPVLRPCIAL